MKNATDLEKKNAVYSKPCFTVVPLKMVPKHRNEYPLIKYSNSVLSDNSHNCTSETVSSLKQVLIGEKN